MQRIAGNGAPVTLALAVGAAALLCPASEASYGDRLPLYRACVDLCADEPLENTTFYDVEAIPHIWEEISWTGSAAKAMDELSGRETEIFVRGCDIRGDDAFEFGDCVDECKYRCQGAVTALRRKAGLDDVQFHGKWYFTRFLGMQELLSAAFSLLNGLPHAINLFDAKRRKRWAPSHYPVGIRMLLVGTSLSSVNTWFWSFAFHSRDNTLTERLDYHFATLFVMQYAFLALMWLYVDVFSCFPKSWSCRKETIPSRLERWKQCGHFAAILGCVMSGAFVQHVYRMNAVGFDYGGNMIFTGLFFVLQLVSWLVWAWCMRAKYRDSAESIFIFQVLLAFAALFEVLDFPPVCNLLDAHALWHGLTIPLGFIWYSFLETVAQDISAVRGKKE